MTGISLQVLNFRNLFDITLIHIDLNLDLKRILIPTWFWLTCSKKLFFDLNPH